MVEINRRNQQRFIRSNNTGDINVVSNTGDDTLDNEDKVIMGDWEDDESIGKRSKFEVMFAGVGNEVRGEDAELYGARVRPKTIRGNNAETTRQKRRDDFIK
jgi:hypothetical protein